MSRFVEAVNSRGEKQRIPAHWLGAPLGKGFRLPPSAQPDARAATRPDAEQPESDEAPKGRRR